MMKKRGKCPSLVTGNSGRPVFKVAGRKSECKRCSCDIAKDVRCVSIPIPGSMGHRTYCCSCLLDIIKQSRLDLDQLERECNN